MLAQAFAEADAARVTGKAVTPFLLLRIVELSGGRSLEVNLDLARNNVRVAGEIATAWAAEPRMSDALPAGILVVGDVIDDTVVIPSGPIRPDTDTVSTIRRVAGGSAANTAAWLADTRMRTSPSSAR